MRNNKLKEYFKEIQNFHLQDLRFENIGEWPTLIRWLAPVVLFLLIIGLFYVSFFWNYSNDIHNFKKQEYSNLNNIKLESRIMQDNKVMKAQVKKIDEHFKKVTDKFPKNININNLIGRLLPDGKIPDLKIQKVDILSTNYQPYYNEIPIRIIAKGNYHAFGKFIVNLANSKEMITINNITIKRNKENNLTMDLTVKAYESNNIKPVVKKKKKKVDNNLISTKQFKN